MKRIGNRFDSFYWCTICGCAIPHADSVEHKGSPHCPCCNTQLRVNARISVTRTKRYIEVSDKQSSLWGIRK